MRNRAHVQAVVRGLSVLLAVAATGLVASGIVHTVFTFNYAIGYTSPWQEFWTLTKLNLTGHLGIAVTLLATAIVLWVFQRPLARLIVPRGGRQCEECGYDLRGGKGTNCPECGTASPPLPP